MQVSYTSWFLDAFNYAIHVKIDVLNLSIGTRVAASSVLVRSPLLGSVSLCLYGTAAPVQAALTSTTSRLWTRSSSCPPTV